jgi:hypothetical protein
MRNNFQNLLCYCYMRYSGKARLDRVQTDVQNRLRLAAITILIILIFIGLIAICFMLQPPSYYSAPLA